MYYLIETGTEAWTCNSFPLKNPVSEVTTLQDKMIYTYFELKKKSNEVGLACPL